jgi:large subunit ribosomal protein L30e
MTIENDIKDAMKSKKALLGTRSVMSAVKGARLNSLIYAKNAPESVVSDLRHFTNISGIEAQEFPGNSVELGELCGKPFSVLLLGITK